MGINRVASMFRLTVAWPLGIAVILSAGCGASLVKTEGVVQLDGTPVEGATVTFASEDGSKWYTGFTDAAGKFVLQSGEKAGATPGQYKVTVVKTPKLSGLENAKPGDPAYLKQMEKGVKGRPGSGTPLQTGSSAPKVNSELPAVYALVTTTPLTATVPSSGPIVLDLKSKP